MKFVATLHPLPFANWKLQALSIWWDYLSGLNTLFANSLEEIIMELIRFDFVSILREHYFIWTPPLPCGSDFLHLDSVLTLHRCIYREFSLSALIF